MWASSAGDLFGTNVLLDCSEKESMIQCGIQVKAHRRYSSIVAGSKTMPRILLRRSAYWKEILSTHITGSKEHTNTANKDSAVITVLLNGHLGSRQDAHTIVRKLQKVDEVILKSLMKTNFLALSQHPLEVVLEQTAKLDDENTNLRKIKTSLLRRSSDRTSRST